PGFRVRVRVHRGPAPDGWIGKKTARRPGVNDILSRRLLGGFSVKVTVVLRSVLCLLAFVTGSLRGQNANGRIAGTVSDTSGAVVQGAKITVTDQATRLNWRTVTDNDGYYVVTSLPV